MQYRISIFLLSFLLAGSTLSAQILQPNKNRLAASRTDQKIEIDGVLDEAAWEQAEIATGFTQTRPNPGQAPSQRTEVRLVYDDAGLYVGAKLYDNHPDSILKEISQRDNFGNTDWFGIFIDAYRDGINGFSFITTPANVQLDAKLSTFGEDENWDAVWKSMARITSDGWIVEMNIPFSSLRFPSVEEQIWHVNFGRMIRRQQQEVFWNKVDPQQSGFFNQAGYLTGITNVSAPVRLQATPFIAVYGEHYHDPNGEPVNSFGRSISGGMDIKYGLSDAFTLDMTLIPDFGEARSDNQVLNLSPFEVRFDENRQFFTEGTELFNKGNLFYSRRIGGRPLHYNTVNDQLQEGETIISNPATTQLYNATKVSGRTVGGLGLGIFNAIAGRTEALIRTGEGEERRIQTNPLTNYNILVLDQNLPNNSYATLINTNVLRNGGDYDANVTGMISELRNKANSYGMRVSAKLSQKYFPDQTDLGHTYSIGLRKISGRVQTGIVYNEESDTFDPNDLGFIFNNNERSVQAWFEYNWFEPFGPFNRATIGFWNRYSRLYRPNTFTDYGINLFAFGQLKNFWSINAWTFHEPGVTFDYFEPRTRGRFYRYPTSNNYGIGVRTDTRKRFQVGVEFSQRTFSQRNRFRRNIELSPRFRFSDRFNVRLEIDATKSEHEEGFTDKRETATGTEVIFGRRDRTTIENELSANYNFSSQMALTFRLRHYWSKVEYASFHLLQDDGGLGPTDYNEVRDQDFDAFNIDMIYRWRFAPGSDIFLIWKNSILGFENITSPDYFSNFEGLFDNPVSNSLSLKVVYFLDYYTLTNK